jgi:hypothetical protein
MLLTVLTKFCFYLTVRVMFYREVDLILSLALEHGMT